MRSTALGLAESVDEEAVDQGLYDTFKLRGLRVRGESVDHPSCQKSWQQLR